MLAKTISLARIALVLAVCIFLGPTSNVSAQTTATWTGDAGTTSYNTPDNWDIGIVPINTVTDHFVVVIGAGVTVDYDVPDGPGGSNVVTQLSLAAGSTVRLQGRNLVVEDSAGIEGKITATSGTFTADHRSTTLSGNRAMLEANTSANPADYAHIVLNASGTYLATNSALNNTSILAAKGSNAAIALPFLATIDSYVDHWGTNTRTISATDGGFIDLSGVTLLRGGSGTSGGLDRVRVIATTGGIVDLSGLQQIDGYVTFTTDAPTFELPSLTHAGSVTYDLPDSVELLLPELLAQSGGGFAIPSGGTVTAAKLQSLNNASVSFTGPGAFGAPLLTNFAGTALTLNDTAQAVTTGGLNQINNARFLLSNGATFNQITDSEYFLTSSAVANMTVMSATGSNTVLDAGSITKIDSYADHWGTNTRTISATDGGFIDLSGVTLLRGGSGTSGGLDRARVIATTGGIVDLSGLQQIDGYVTFTTDAPTFELPSLTHAGSVTYELPDSVELLLPELLTQSGGGFAIPSGGTVTAAKLQSLNNASVSFTGPGAFGAPLLTNFAGTALTLNDTAQAVTTGGLNQINNARFLLSNGATFNQITDSEYFLTSSAVANTTVMSATGSNTVLDAGSITKIDSYADHWGTNTRTISATDGGLIDLSGVTLLRGGSGTSGGLDRVRVIATTGGEVDLRSLTTVQGFTVFEALAGGRLSFGDLAMTGSTNIRADGLGSKITATDLMLDPSAVVTVTDGAEIELAGSLQNDMTDAGAFDMDTGILRVRGVESAWLEVAGQDLGNTVSSGNFGMMQLVLGSPAESMTLFLTDMYDNDGLGQSSREALYLFGSGGVDGLEIYGGSHLVIGDIPVYAFLGGSMVELQTLFQPTEIIVPFVGDGEYDGFLVKPIPGDANMDGSVDLDDFVILKQNFGATPATWAQGDFNLDGVVDLDDFAVLKRNFGIQAIPEPASLALLAMGGLAVLRQRRR